MCRKQITRSEFERFVISDPETGEPVLHLCRTCYELWHLGGKLPKTEVFVRTGKDFREDHRKSVELPFSRFHWLDSAKLLESVSFPEGSEVLLRNTLDPRGVPAGYVPIPYVVADYAKLTEDGNIMDLEKLAENSVGAGRIAVLKADVDDLGLIFGTGLPKTNPALVANLSRLLDYFFKAYLNSIIRGEVSIGRNLPELPTARELGAEKHPGNHGTKANIVVVYAGGDDLFILGAWNEIFNLAFRIRELLREYTGRNPNVTLSAGIGTFPHSYQVERMAIVTEERLETAKDEGKDRICLMGRSIPEDGTFTVSYPWGLYSELWRKYGKPFHIGAGKLALNGKEVPKSALWKLLEFRELYSMDPLGVSWSYLAAYHLSRAGLDESMKDIVALDVRKYRAGEPQEIFWIDGILKILLMAVRR
ncbi:hypothetical protein APY94_04225 [Thermococcus celericrescens]|uniref:GGDEF domain-containing protein n=1 Tax=Thermococcus celericrescens TaxID=227598 RepID=A0A100XYQ9_9EURY|nr:hypothetical protein [Thermococcus celericrescens]KUH33943.1 hypothetical protein APY94_04225 [Thermococcus celericrescens]